MQVFQRSRGRFGALQNDISGNAMGSAAAGSPFLWEHTWAAWCPLQLKLRRQGGMARALWLSSFLLSLPSWSRTWPGTFLVRSSSTCPATTQGCQNQGWWTSAWNRGFHGDRHPQELGLAPALCPVEPPKPGVTFPAGRAAHEQPPRWWGWMPPSWHFKMLLFKGRGLG